MEAPTVTRQILQMTRQTGASAPGKIDPAPLDALDVARDLLVWAKSRLERIRLNLEGENAPDFAVSNQSHRDDIVLLIRDLQRGMSLVSKFSCTNQNREILLAKLLSDDFCCGAKLGNVAVNGKAQGAQFVENLKGAITNADSAVEALLASIASVGTAPAALNC